MNTREAAEATREAIRAEIAAEAAFYRDQQALLQRLLAEIAKRHPR